MECAEIVFSRHAVLRMFQRGISVGDVREVLATGSIIAEYPDDKPFPSRLVFGFVASKPIHVVVAFDSISGRCDIVTAYVPDGQKWTEDFKSRRTV